MLFAPTICAPDLVRVVTDLHLLEYWDDSGANGSEVKFDF